MGVALQAERRAASSLSWLAIAGIAAAILVLALAMPKRENVSDCIVRIPLGFGLTYANNCDSVHITRDARNLARFVTSPSPSRSRPAHILAVSAVAHVLAPVLVPAAATLAPLKERAGELLPFYLAAIIVNAGVLALAFGAFCRLVGGPWRTLDSVALMALLASYDVTIAWFWIPHQIFMNVLVPLGGTLAFVTGLRAAHLSTRAVALMGLATAAGALAYGYCLVWPVAFGLGVLFAHARDGWSGFSRAVITLLPFGVAFVVPLGLWFGSFWLAGREIAYEAQSAGQFAWVNEALAQRNLIAEIGWRLGRQARALAEFLGLWGGAVIAAAGVAAGFAIRTAPAGHRRIDPVFVGALVTAVLMLTFNFLQGYHQGRLLMFPLLLGQLVLLRTLVLAGRSRFVAPVAAAMALVQVVGGCLGPPSSMG